ncbi:MAG TPA: hypothetical protein VGK39_07745 [Cyclobacteriaceae bacterium]
MKFAILFASFLSSQAFLQEVDFWKTLADVRIETKTNNNLEMDVPKFGKQVSAINGKKIKLKGYLIPLSEFGGKNEYMLSALPFSTCFFCGGAGPETVVELQVKQSLKFTTDRIVLEGTLILNPDDPDHHMYILKDVKLID